jgi:hypothetical protein
VQLFLSPFVLSYHLEITEILMRSSHFLFSLPAGSYTIVRESKLPSAQDLENPNEWKAKVSYNNFLSTIFFLNLNQKAAAYNTLPTTDTDARRLAV